MLLDMDDCMHITISTSEKLGKYDIPSYLEWPSTLQPPSQQPSQIEVRHTHRAHSFSSPYEGTKLYPTEDSRIYAALRKVCQVSVNTVRWFCRCQNE